MTYLIMVNFSISYMCYVDVIEEPKARLEELSNNISERLTGRKPVREQSERASGYIVG